MAIPALVSLKENAAANTDGAEILTDTVALAAIPSLESAQAPARPLLELLPPLRPDLAHYFRAERHQAHQADRPQRRVAGLHRLRLPDLLRRQAQGPLLQAQGLCLQARGLPLQALERHHRARDPLPPAPGHHRQPSPRQPALSRQTHHAEEPRDITALALLKASAAASMDGVAVAPLIAGRSVSLCMANVLELVGQLNSIKIGAA
ncbi:hypothetical protein FB567DRAFT_536149 [Paraphoma chrysanthemicola]|uniref:Uncharacterized protein n=1 Tax=Paraphoma chrysanthemicola TaxID=798071 RepID=A0A8K0QXT7_9PLEO|nr:hypothetical protein FB567DRAFT_536149 [Paraphoma chrysanthemicola]